MSHQTRQGIELLESEAGQLLCQLPDIPLPFREGQPCQEVGLKSGHTNGYAVQQGLVQRIGGGELWVHGQIVTGISWLVHLPSIADLPLLQYLQEQVLLATRKAVDLIDQLPAGPGPRGPEHCAGLFCLSHPLSGIQKAHHLLLRLLRIAGHHPVFHLAEVEG